MHELAQHVLQYVKRHSLVRPGDRIGAAVSGGADSLALFRILLELRGDLGVSLCVLHFNHQLRGEESDADEKFVKELADRSRIQFQSSGQDVKLYAMKNGLSTEAAARHLRYEYFKQLIADGLVKRVATAHTLDDQAETVLLRAVRGTGTAGLAGIYPKVTEPGGAIIRPLLGVRRLAIENYLNEINQRWREDRSNRDLRHTRNRVRHGILPRLERNFNPSVRESLADTAEIARAEEEYWDAEVAKAMPDLVRGHGDKFSLRIDQLCKLPLALQRRMIRSVALNQGFRLEFRHVEEILEVCSGAKKSAVLPQGRSATRTFSGELVFTLQGESIADYEHVLAVPGQTYIEALPARFEVLLVSGTDGYPAEHLFDEGLLDKELVVRNWRAGDRFWPAHTKAPKKVKELLQERHITGSERKLWPVVVSGRDVLWMRGFSRPQAWQAQPGSTRAILIREVAAIDDPASL